MPGDFYFNEVVLLALNENGADGTTAFDDASNSNRTLTAVGNTQWDTAQAPTGLTSSGLFDGTGDLITAADAAALEPAASSFTLEGFFRTAVTTGSATICSKRASSAVFGPFVIFRNGTTLEWYASSDGATWDVANAKAFGTVAADSWYHFALVRDGNSFTPYLHGTAGAGTVTSAASLLDNAGSFNIGAESSGFDFNGWIASVRYTVGVARYTANFTPPSLPLPTTLDPGNTDVPVRLSGGQRLIPKRRKRTREDEKRRLRQDEYDMQVITATTRLWLERWMR